jgi:hypothetical protein
MADRIQIRRDTAANWASINPILAQGEMGIETDTLQFKVGNGTAAWNSLAYLITATSGSVVSTNGTQTLTNKTLTSPQLNTAISTGHRETSVAMSASDIDLAAGNYFTKTISATTTFTVSNVAPSGTVSAFVLELTDGGSETINYFSGVTWPQGLPPVLTISGVDVLAFFTTDGGITWRAFALGLDIKVP